MLSKKDIQMPKLAFQNFVASDPYDAFLLVPAGTHSVCVCTSHQNAQLLVHAANIGKDYHDLMAMVVCDLNTKMCMIHRCENCPGDNNLREYLDERLLTQKRKRFLSSSSKGLIELCYAPKQHLL